MIITRSPLRISLGGGGTDVPSYYRDHGGFVIAAAIDKYVYITLHQTFEQGLILKYSEIERTKEVDGVRHPLIRESLRLLGVEQPFLEIASMADIPAGTGLGSSGSFTTALLQALHVHAKRVVHPRLIAEQACHIELDVLKTPVGKQDQYIAAFGGLICMTYTPDGEVEVVPLKLESDILYTLEENLILFYTGFTRSAASILAEQNDLSTKKDTVMTEKLHQIKEIGVACRQALEEGRLKDFAALMHEHWLSKRGRSSRISSEAIDHWYELGMEHGALGGKLIGAGGGGFLMFYAEDKVSLRRKMREVGLPEVRFRFDFEGTKVVSLS
jgi:D-glycero-alpha-D-manno-heptose-7-phosphate kinase